MISQHIAEVFHESNEIKQILGDLDHKESVRVTGVNGSAAAFVLFSLFSRGQKKCFCVVENDHDAKQLFEDIIQLVDENRVCYFPALKKQIWNEVGPSGTEVGRRILALKSIIKQSTDFVITNSDALLEKIASPEDVELYSLHLQNDDELDFELFKAQLVEMGFNREERVESPGEFSVRGGLVDVFLYEEDHPIRIEFFGNQIESIRQFDVETQRSIGQLNVIHILPLGCAGPYSALEDRTLVDLVYKSTLFDYLDSQYLLTLFNEPLILRQMEDYEREIQVRFETLNNDNGLESLNWHTFFQPAAYFEQQFQRRQRLYVDPIRSEAQDTIQLPILQNAHFGGNLKLFRSEIKSQKNSTIYLACDSDSQTQRIRELLAQEGYPQTVHIVTLNLSAGFSWPEKQLFLYTSRELYSRVRLPKLDKMDKRAVTFREQLAIHKGDYVVHTDYGIGEFLGLEQIKAYGKIRECLAIQYQDGDKLYVPLEKMDQVQKYSSSEGVVPVLNKLGSPNWEKLKVRTKKRMKEIAEELIKLYATRKMRPGFEFSEDTIWQKELEASFQFEETVDQLSAINDVKKDMQTARPMDRLICGDVGYGKTELAIRAAFKAINESKQVAVLVPTTILAEQHFHTFAERMKNFPVKLNVLSRFKTPKQQKEILEQLKNGELDLVVGTHRLLSKDVKFRDLGLLIVDEEQRFGVVHKEKLKLLKVSVDTLTLSATPIPRTMHMAMLGAKDMSIINSPPNSRIPIKTEVSRFDNELIRESILREIDRGGQVFFVHNRVQSIYGIAALLNDLVPEVKVAVAHGQMKGHELEKAMLKFIDGQVQVLVCTMIIENGIDMPKANTLIINRADRFGLAQLYQLRGRVGRSDQQAYAYLLIPPVRKLTREAIKRLQTIQEYSELGSGYKIAMRDLEIRGAGNIFGAEQTGFVNALGYELYTKIIHEAVHEIKSEMDIGTEQPEEIELFDSKVECAVDAYLPEDYISSPSERVDIYRRLVQAKKLSIIQDIRTELIDRFGPTPPHAENLLDYIVVKLLASLNKLSKISIGHGKLIGEFDIQVLPKQDEFRSWLANVVSAAPDSFELQQEDHSLKFEIKVSSEPSLLSNVKKFLQSIV